MGDLDDVTGRGAFDQMAGGIADFHVAIDCFVRVLAHQCLQAGVEDVDFGGGLLDFLAGVFEINVRLSGGLIRDHDRLIRVGDRWLFDLDGLLRPDADADAGSG